MKNKKIAIVVFALLLVSSCSSKSDVDRKNSTTETAYLLDGKQNKNIWGRDKVGNEYRYKSIPYAICLYFINALPYEASARGKKVNIYIKGKKINTDSEDFIVKLTRECSNKKQSFSIVVEG